MVLVDIGAHGSRYTWCNGHPGQSYAMARLDRGLADVQWQSSAPSTILKLLPASFSDHFRLLLHLGGERLVRPFKFEGTWVWDPRSHLVVRKA